jgi:hypothetical protein
MPQLLNRLDIPFRERPVKLPLLSHLAAPLLAVIHGQRHHTTNATHNGKDRLDHAETVTRTPGPPEHEPRPDDKTNGENHTQCQQHSDMGKHGTRPQPGRFELLALESSRSTCHVALPLRRVVAPLSFALPHGLIVERRILGAETPCHGKKPSVRPATPLGHNERAPHRFTTFGRTTGDLIKRLAQEGRPRLHTARQRSVPDHPTGSGDPEQNVRDAIDLNCLRHPFPPAVTNCDRRVPTSSGIRPALRPEIPDLALAGHRAGRPGRVPEDPLPAAQPANFRLHSGEVVIRVACGAKLATATGHSVVAFEADEFDPGATFRDGV